MTTIYQEDALEIITSGSEKEGRKPNWANEVATSLFKERMNLQLCSQFGLKGQALDTSVDHCCAEAVVFKGG